jgi:hypothetical protein
MLYSHKHNYQQSYSSIYFLFVFRMNICRCGIDAPLWKRWREAAQTTSFLPGGEVWAHRAVLLHHRMEADKTICGGACMYELGAVSSRWHGTCYSHTMPPVRWYRGQQWAGSRSRSRSHGQPNLLYDCEVRRLYGRRAARIAVRVGAAEGRPCARAMVTITSSRRGTPWRLDWSLIQLLAD